MGSGSESAAERVAAKWEVGPKEEVVQAFMETLVDPRLPLTVSVNDPPTEDAQNSVARQMHAVVLLYNYYHRKQKPDLEFLDFVSFCKLALLLRPSLIPFMKMMNESELVELTGAEDQLSVTEKAVKDACDIAVALDASKDIPATEGCPISKVAVLLIDSEGENCLLLFGAITEGVWSLIEKELNELNINQERSAEAKVTKKRKINRTKASTDDPKFLQLGYDAVKDITGIESSALVVLETHVAYSLNKQKSAAQFYMMQCPQSFSINQRFPLKFLVESLQGPLAEKHYDSWATTTVVEYHRMLPYVGFISSWLSRNDLCLPSLNGHNAQSITRAGEKEHTQSVIPALPVPKYSEEDLDHIDSSSSEMKVSSSEKIAIGNSEGDQKKCKHSSSSKVACSVVMFQSAANGGNVTDEFNKRCDILSSSEKDTSRISLENLDNDNDKHEVDSLSGPSRMLSQSIVKDTNAEKIDERSKIVDSAVKEGTRIKLEILDTDCEDQRNGSLSRGPSQMTASDENISQKFNKRCDKTDSATMEDLDNSNYECINGLSSGRSRGLQRVNMCGFTNSCLKNEDSNEKLNSKIRVYHHRRKSCSSAQHDAYGPDDDVQLKVEMADHLKLNDTQRRDENEDNHDVTILCNQNGNDVIDNALIQSQPASEDLQNAVALLYRKRLELCSQICTMEDTLALYEDYIERIRDGGDVGLARQCIKSIVDGNNNLLLKNETEIQDKGHQPSEDHSSHQSEKQTRTRLSDPFLPGRSSCQDLEYICLKNNWRLPRYFVKPSDGKFMSNVTVEGKDLKLISEGGWESSPLAARESAAAQMIAKIRDAWTLNCDQACD
ncbi:uncharacterized protein LOC105173510 isoform X2 [Sesamum indicum]|uniref:Uncharacterized protein LOC105173510 isoform X2 n=1 Tax=Sesamum indicum TaxID=4182 RepID=A0A6I9UHA3_SESIN|nr:uncharacterized protein LOC105173510 isoform X2 [Sesamum indicum]